jgi:putative membrane protein
MGVWRVLALFHKAMSEGTYRMIKKFLYRVFCGFFLGLSVFAPGFSGSIIAIAMGIYQDLLRIASNPFKRLKENIVFCLPLGIGAMISGVLFVLVFKFLFDTYEKATYLLFVGLITGNLPLIFTEIKKCGFKKHYLIGGVAAFAAALFLGIFAAGVEQTSAVEGAASLFTLALGGAAAGITTLIPGMSVSMVLLIMGVYRQLISMADALLHMNFTDLVPFGVFGVCAIAGLILASRGIKAVFEKFPGFANSMVFGFMSGSLFGILIQSLQTSDADFSWLLGGVMLLAGLGISMLFVVLQKVVDKNLVNPVEPM